MNPTKTYQISTPNQDNSYKQKLRLLKYALIALAVLLLVMFIYNTYKARQFRVVSTNPATNNVAAITPFFDVTFNKQISDGGISVSSDKNIIKSFGVKGMTLDINLNTPMDTNKQYTITITNVSDTSGDTIKSKSFTFTPQDIDYDQLPQDQKDAIAKQKPPVADQFASTNFVGMSDLVSHGITTDQINDLTKAFSTFAPHAKTITIDPNSIQAAPHNPNVDTTFATNFTVTIDADTYRAKISYADLSSLDLQLFNPQTSKVVYDSGTISPSQ